MIIGSTIDRLRRLRLRPRLLALSALALVAVGAPLATTALVAKRVDMTLTALGLKGEIAVEPFSGRVTLRSVQGRLGPDLAFEIGSLALPSGAGLIPSAFAAQDVTLNDVAISWPGFVLNMPSVEVSGSNVDKEQVARLFSQTETRPLDARLADFAASAILVPELTLKQTIGAQQSRFAYRDLRLSGIAKGRAAEGSATEGQFELVEPRGVTKGRFGKSRFQGIDLALLARIYQAEADPSAELKTLYENVAVESFAMTIPGGTEVTMARAVGKDTRARPIGRAWSNIVSLLDRKIGIAELPASERAQFLRDFLDMVSAFEIGSGEAFGFEMRNLGGEPDARGTVARVAYAQTAQGLDLQIEATETVQKATRSKIGSMALTGLSFAPTIEALRDILKDPAADLEDIDVRLFIPQVRSFAMRDIAAIPLDAGQDAASGKPKVSIKRVEAIADNPVRGIPITLAVAIDNLVMTIPPDTKVDGLKIYLDLGYSVLDVSAALDVRWDESSRALQLNNLSFGGVDMFNMALNAEIGNVGRDVFAGNLTDAGMALLGATVKSLSFVLDEKGFIDRAIIKQAKDQGVTPDQARKESGKTYAAIIAQTLGSSPNAKAIGAAVAKFHADPGRLTITAKSKSPGGVGFTDYIAAGSPQALLDLLNVTAKAE